MRPLVQTPVQINEKFADAVHPYLKGLQAYCRSLTNSQWDGEDLAQETLLKAYKSWEEKSKPVTKAYLYRIASNAWIDRYRKRAPEEEFRADLADFPLEKPDSALFEAMEVLIEKLTPKQRAAVLLVDGLGYSPQEAAQWLDSTEGSVKAALHRARKKLEKGRLHDFEMEDEVVMPYVQAFRTGKTSDIVKLFRSETGEPQMSAGTHSSTSFSSFQSVGDLYLIVAFRAKNGTVWAIPFFQKELSAILFQLEEEYGMAA